MTKRLLFAVARAKALKPREPQGPVTAILVFRNDRLAGSVQVHTFAFRVAYTWVPRLTIYPDLGSAIEDVVRVDQTFMDPLPKIPL